MTPQQQADEYLSLWQTLRARGVPPENRLAVIDRLLNRERAMTVQQDKPG